MRAAWLVAWTAAGLAAGGAAGLLLRRATRDAAVPPSPPPRPPPLAEAWAARDAGDVERLRRAVAALDAADLPRAAWTAEADVLKAAAVGSDDALAAASARHPGTPAAATADLLRALRAPEGAEREARRAAFARTWPGSWFARAGGAR